MHDPNLFLINKYGKVAEKKKYNRTSKLKTTIEVLRNPKNNKPKHNNRT